MLNSLFDALGMTYAAQEVARHARVYDIYEKYYLGFQYDDSFIKRYFRLYAQTREFYTLISRAVDIDVQLVPGGWVVTPEAAQQTITDVLAFSDWRVAGGMMVHLGALFGDIYLKLAGSLEEPIVQPLDPRGVWLEPDRCVIIRDLVDLEGTLYEHGEVLTADAVIIYRDGKRADEFANPFGVVPVFYGQNKNVGKLQGLNTFHNVLDEINAINETATFLQQVIMKNLSPQKVISGADENELVLGPDKTVFLPEGAVFNAVQMILDTEGTVKFIQDIHSEVKLALPELVFDSFREMNIQRLLQVELAVQELDIKIRRMRLGYDGVLAKAVNAILKAQGKAIVPFEFDPDRPVLEFSETPVQPAPINVTATESGEGL